MFCFLERYPFGRDVIAENASPPSWRLSSTNRGSSRTGSLCVQYKVELQRNERQQWALDEVLDQYNFMFSFFTDGSFGLGCDPDAPVCLSEQDKADIISYMQLLSFEKP